MSSHPFLMEASRLPSIADERQGGWSPRGSLLRYFGVRRHLIVDFARSFAVLISARISLVQALTTLSNQSRHPRLRAAIDGIRDGVKAGRTLSECFAMFPKTFDVLFVHLTRIGESAGILDEVLLRIASYLEKRETLRRKLRAASLYPIVVLTVAAIATTFLLTRVVPTFADMFADFGAELPAPTRVVIRLSDVLTQHFILLVVVLLVTSFTMILYLRSPMGQIFWDSFRLRVPIVGSLLRKSLVARFCRTLGTLLNSGVVLTDALGVAGQAVNNTLLKRELDHILHVVRRGGSLNMPLQRTGLFPEMVVQMMAVGEQTAELDRMLLHAAEHYEQEVDAAVEGLTSIVEPILIVVIGAILGAILTALYLPMFDLITVVG